MSLTTQLSRFRNQLIAVFMGLFVLASLTLLPKVFAGLETPPSDVPRVAAADANGPASRTVSRQMPAIAVNGELFLLEVSPEGVRKLPVKTSMPVFKSFGRSSDGTRLLYSPLKKGIPSGDLVYEDLTTGSFEKIGKGVVIAAAISPADDNQIAYTYAGDESFSLATIKLGSGQAAALVSDNVFAETIQWDETGAGIHYYLATNEEVDLDLVSRFASESAFEEFLHSTTVETGTARQDSVLKLTPAFAPVSGDKLAYRPAPPAGFPELKNTSTTASKFYGSRDQDVDPPAPVFPFSAIAPGDSYEVSGPTFIGSDELTARNTINGQTVSLGNGQLVDVLGSGIIKRQFTPSGTRFDFVDWNGTATALGMIVVNYNVPIASGMLTQGGALYPPPGNCNLSAHFGNLGHGYDFQGPIVGAHALSSADGLVVLGISSVTCNRIDGDCVDFSPTSCPGTYLGNLVIIQHSDGTYTKYAHMETNSLQVVVGMNACQGLYIGRQGHTGSTNGDFNGCGDHLHFQRQSTPDLSGPSIAVDFDDVAAEPLSCFANYVSGSTERSHSISPSSQNVGIPGGANNVNVTSTGCSWTASSNAPWITITSGTGGSGNGAVSYTVTDNSASGPRTGTMIIAGQTFTVTQDGGGVTNQPPVVDAGPDQTIILPANSDLNGSVTDDGLPAPPAVTSSWSKISGPGTVSFGDPAATDTTATFSLAGIYILRLTANDGEHSGYDEVRVIVNVGTGGGSISGSRSAPPGLVDLTAQGVSDWAHWGILEPDSYDHKAGVTSEIGNFTMLGDAYIQSFNGGSVNYRWDDGTPTSSAVTATGTYIYGLGNGYQLTLPADTNQRILKLYVGIWRSGARLEVSISDGSASPYVDTTLNDPLNVVNAVYTINYRAASPGQTLTIRYTVDSLAIPAGNIALQAATLVVVPPDNAAPRVDAGSDQIVALPATAALAGTASDDGLPAPPAPPATTWSQFSGPGTVTFGNANALNTTAAFSTAGTYVLRLTGSDGVLNAIDDMTVTVNDGGATGLVSVAGTEVPPIVNLTTEGTADWTHWGLETETSFNRKAAVTPQISNFTPLGTAPILRYSNNPNLYSWTDGTPTTTTANSSAGLYVIGSNNGFQLTVPSDTAVRTLKLYIGLWSAGGRLEVTSTDGTSPTFIDTSLVNSSATSNRVYTINYQAASPGQTITIKWTVNATFNPWSNVTLQAATLIQAPPSGNSISGKIRYAVPNPGTKTVPGVNVTAVGTPQVQTTTDNAGDYILNGLSSGSYTVTPVKSGGVNGITSFDAALAGRHAVGILTLNPNQQIAADASNDGLVTSFDAALIGRTAVGIPNPGQAGTWEFVAASTNYNLSGSLTGQDYNAYLLGDVSGDWTPPGGFAYTTPAILPSEKHFPSEGIKAQPHVGDSPKVFAGGAIPVSFPANTIASNNTVVEIPISVGNTTGQGIISADMVITFNDTSTVLQRSSPVVSAPAGTVAGDAGCTFNIPAGTGSPLTIGMVCISNDLSGFGTLFNLRFLVTGTHPATTPLTFQSFIFNGGTPAAVTTNGTFTVQGPTAASVSVGGRVVNASGYGIRRARMTLANSAGQLRTVMTNNFGYYRFTGVDSGEIYTISVDAKRYHFDKPSRVLVVLDDVTDADFIANN